MHVPEFTVTVTAPAPDCALVTVTGELDLATAPQLRSALREAAATGRRMIVEMSGCGFCDSSGLRTLLDADLAAKSAGRSFRLAAAGPHLRRVIELTGLTGHLALYPDLPHALTED